MGTGFLACIDISSWEYGVFSETTLLQLVGAQTDKVGEIRIKVEVGCEVAHPWGWRGEESKVVSTKVFALYPVSDGKAIIAFRQRMEIPRFHL